MQNGNQKNADSESVGKKLSKLRKAYGYTQTDFADKLGVKRSVVADYERDKVRINIDLLLKIASLINISLDEILDLETSKGDENRMYDLKFMKRLKKISELPESKQKTILSSLDMMIDSAEKKNEI